MGVLSLISLLFFVKLASCSTNLHLTVDVLKPENSSKPEAALVLTPGNQIKGSSYKPLAELLQKRSSFRLWVAILDGFSNNVPDLLQLTMVFSDAVNKLNKEGYGGQKVFLAGHGLGGSLVSEYGETKNNYLEGLVVYSAFPDKIMPLKEYHVPILTLNGELDGLSRITRVVDTFTELQEQMEKDDLQQYRTPVIVMEGVNHGQFSQDKMPVNMSSYDLVAEVSQSAAFDMISNYTDAFLVMAKNDSTTNVTTAMSLLDSGVSKTAAIFQPLSSLKNLDQNKEKVSHWTITAQQLVVGLTDSSSVEFINHEDKTPDPLSKTKVNSAATVTIESSTKMYLPDNPDAMGIPVSPIQLKATMKSQKAIKKLLPSMTYEKPASCKQINEEAFLLAFSKASPAAKERYSSRGRPMIFMEDHVILHSGFEWSRSNLKLHYNRTGLYVAATRFNMDHIDGQDGSDHSPENDCTLLSPFRAFEWIYIDSLKFTTPTTVSSNNS